jgi:hypothetical protein
MASHSISSNLMSSFQRQSHPTPSHSHQLLIDI